jgi:predicted RNase H-like nuclease (RuvC/YqgF family)
MNKEQLESSLKINSTEIELLDKRITSHKANIEKFKLDRLKKALKNTTIEELENLWNTSDQDVRFEILELNNSVNEQMNKLEGYGGVKYGEIFDEVVEKNWDESIFIRLSEYYERYCKK